MAILRTIEERRSLRFVIVGVGAALALMLMSWGFVAAGLPASMGTVLAYGIAFLCAYLLQRNWTFRVSHSHTRSLPRYLLTQVVCAGLAGLTAQLAVSWFGASPAVMAVVATAVGSGASYLLSSRWAFA